MRLGKIETGRIATPAFFTVAALARTLGVDLPSPATVCEQAHRAAGEATAERDATHR